MAIVKAALVGAWHVHGLDFAEKLISKPECEIVALWGKGEDLARRLNCRREENYESILEAKDINSIILSCSTAQHEKMIIKAAQAGKHIFVEKSLAISNEAAYSIKDAVEAAEICFVMSDPVMKSPQMFAKRAIETGNLGIITNVRICTVHDGAARGKMHSPFYKLEESGGGAMIDMGCKAVHILYQLLGRPEKAESMFWTYTSEGKENKIEENCVVCYQFPGGAIGIAEAGWYSPKYQFSMDIYGTKGSICQRDDRIFVHMEKGSWEEIPQEKLPPAMEYPLEHWINSIKSGKKNCLYGVEEAVILTEMITAAYRGTEGIIMV